VEAFVAATRELDDDAATLAATLWAHTAGNPFFVGELLRHLDETGNALGADVPAGVVEVVTRRIGRLPAPAQHILTVASVVGASFALDTVEAATATAADDDHDSLDHLEAASAAGLVAEEAPGAWRFAHALVRDAHYRRLSATRRARLHRRVAEAIEAAPGPDATRLPALAHHFAEAAPTGCAAKAADYAVAAAEQALVVAGYEEAATFLAQGVKALDSEQPPDQRRRAALLVLQAQAHFGDFRNELGQDVALLATEAALAAGDDERFAEAAFLQCVTRGPNRGTRENELVRAAVDGLGDRRPDLRASLLAVSKAWAEMTDDLFDEALALARECGDRTALISVLEERWGVLGGTPRAAELLAAAEELVAFEEVGQSAFGFHPFTGVHPAAYDKRATARLILGDRTGFDEDVEELDRLASTAGFRSAIFAGAQWRVVQALLDGRFSEVPRLAAHFEDVFPYAVPPGRHDTMVYWEQGRFAPMAELSERLSQRLPQIVHLRARLVLARTMCGDADIRPVLADLVEGLPTVRKFERLLTAAHLSEAAVALGDRPSCSRLYDAMRPYSGQVVAGFHPYCLGSVDRHLGMLATILERWDQARAHLETALAVDTGLRSPPMVARTQYWYADLLTRMPGGDHLQARELAEAAGSTARALGMSGLEHQIDELFDEIHA
jgi:hypothetical protein